MWMQMHSPYSHISWLETPKEKCLVSLGRSPVSESNSTSSGEEEHNHLSWLQYKGPIGPLLLRLPLSVVVTVSISAEETQEDC